MGHPDMSKPRSAIPDGYHSLSGGTTDWGCFRPVAARNRSIMVDFDYPRLLSSGISRERRKGRKNQEIRSSSPSTIPIHHSRGEEASTRLHRENKLQRLRLPTRDSHRDFVGTFLLPAQASRGEDVSSLRLGRRNEVTSIIIIIIIIIYRAIRQSIPLGMLVLYRIELS
ncbi:hypothetical protein B296_00042344 [Ensete ventricosum]|uniref:Uncharacterized protein n=1 Tax=Ensete ventricosum TaxID=4639 RepID=A0A426ZIT0_ENSVE|nr:hypothetical protein B296_00042344 [Ensete ventricosum]